MGQYGNQPDFGTRAVAITPKGFAGGAYVNIPYNEDDETSNSVFITSRNLNVSTFNDGTPIIQALSYADWVDNLANSVACWAYENFASEDVLGLGKVYNRIAASNPLLYSPGYGLILDSVAGNMADARYNKILGKELKSIPTGEDGEVIYNTNLWQYSSDPGTNTFGFNGLPGGYMYYDDESFVQKNQTFTTWVDDPANGKFIHINYEQRIVEYSNASDQNGYFIRLAVNPNAVGYSAAEPLNSAALYVGTGGDLVVTIVGSETPVMFKNVPDASFLPIIVSNVWERGDMGLTTASDIIAIY